MLEQELRGIPGICCLPRRKVPLLRAGYPKKYIPVWLCFLVIHTQIVTYGYVLCVASLVQLFARHPTTLDLYVPEIKRLELYC
jgi:hypothetical protein